MKLLPALGLSCFAILTMPAALAAPVVSNLSAAQRSGTQLVDITYDVSAPGFPAVAVSLQISSDAGATWTVPSASATGDIGASVAPGTGKAIVWDAGEDWAGNYSEQMRFRVVADDGFAYIPGGSFMMGRTSGDTDASAPPITVTLSPFYIAETETTKALWDEVRTWATSNGYSDLAAGAGKAGNHPVQTVSWWDVVKWCNARSEKEGLTPVYTVGGNVMRTGTTEPDVNWSANGYRLPTEAEWEKAARGGVIGNRFPWVGDTISHAEANFRNNGGEPYQSGTSDYHPTYAVGGEPYTSPVGSFAANGFGLKDMSGNVWEWCWDWHGSDFYTTSDGTTDPRGPASGGNRVIRGGAWNYSAIHGRCSDRGVYAPWNAFNGVGFRTARSHLVDGMSLISAGGFAMGVTSGDTDSNAPSITVTVSSFYIAETETTKAQWDEVRTWAGSNGYTDLPTGGGKAPDHPVQTVNWWDVVKWCNARSEKEGLTPVYTVGGSVMRTGATAPDVNWSANGYRLPTEAEWEKAARGGASGKRFPWGSDTISHAEANFRNNGGEPYQSGTSDYHPTYAVGGEPYTSMVGSFASNGYGLKDMAGNVWEWCWDWYDSGFYTTSNGTTDPHGPGSGSNRVIRGGSWSNDAFNARCAFRLNYNPAQVYNDFGFRCARSHVVEGMSLIPGGSFTMGATSGDTDSNAPSITVTVSSFHMAKTETTKALWDEVRTWAVANGYTDLATGGGKASDHPVQTVSWWDVVKWCNARSEKEGLTPVYTVGGSVMRTGATAPDVNWSANGYRLPTEAEWEKAARGGVSGKRFPWGTDTITHTEANYRGSTDYAYDESVIKSFHPTYATGGYPWTSPVGSFAANGYGLEDMSGNVFEWCWDWYEASYYTTSNGTTDPRGAASGSLRVYRGGSWDGRANLARAGDRNYSTPTLSYNGFGFRTARSFVSVEFPETGDVTVDTRSNNADLSALTISSGTLSPAFASGTTVYTASVSNATTPITVTPTRADANATIEVRVNGLGYVTVSSGSPSDDLDLNVGANPIEIRVTSQDLTTQKTYTITVTRLDIPAVTSPTIASITGTGATLGGNVTGDGDAVVTERGVVYSVTTTNNDPLIGGGGVTKVTTAGTTGIFAVPVTGLTQGTGYSFKAYAINSEGTSYSAVSSFYTDTLVAFTGGMANFTRDLLPGGRHRYDFTLDGAKIFRWASTGGAPLRAELRDAGANVIVSFEGDGNFDLEELLLAGDYVLEVYRVEETGPAQYALTLDASEVAATRPDVSVGTTATAPVGASVYLPSRQLVSLTSRKARSVTGYAAVSNRGKLPDDLALSSSRGNAFFKVEFFDSQGNVTAALLSGTYLTPEMKSVDAPIRMRVAVTPNKKKLTKKKGRKTTILKKTLTSTLTAGSTFDPAVRDAASIQVRTK